MSEMGDALKKPSEEMKGKLSKLERLEFRVLSLVTDGYDHLNEWEKDFVTSLNSRRLTGTLGNLTGPQEKTLLRLWTDAHAKGYVQLPKGMF